MKARIDEFPDELEPGQYVVQAGPADEHGTVTLRLLDPATIQVFPAGAFEAFGTKWDATVSRHGTFEGVLRGSPETRVQARDWDDMLNRAKVIARKRRARLHVEFTEVSQSGSVRHGVVYGLNAGSGKPMVEWDDGTKDTQYSASYGYGGMAVLPPMSKEDAEKAKALRIAAAQSARDWSAFFGDQVRRTAPAGGSWNLDTEVQRAVEEAMKEATRLATARE
jgi:hypothetical protein